MADGKRPHRWLSYGLIAAGIVVLLAVGGYLGLSQLRGAQVRSELRQTPPAGETNVSPTSATGLRS